MWLCDKSALSVWWILRHYKQFEVCCNLLRMPATTSQIILCDRELQFYTFENKNPTRMVYSLCEKRIPLNKSLWMYAPAVVLNWKSCNNLQRVQNGYWIMFFLILCNCLCTVYADIYVSGVFYILAVVTAQCGSHTHIECHLYVCALSLASTCSR